MGHFNFGVSDVLAGNLLQGKEASMLVERQNQDDQHLPGAFWGPAGSIPTKAPMR